MPSVRPAQPHTVTEMETECGFLSSEKGSKRLTFPALPFLHDGLQPFLLLLRGLGHADEPLVLRSVVDLPAVVHYVAAAVVVGCEERRRAQTREILTPLVL